MKVYIDVVFLLNIILDFVILMSISVLLKRNVTVKRLILGSIVGGITIFILFVNISSLELFILKILIGIVMVIITFGFRDIRYTLNNVFYLYTVSFILGGGITLIKNIKYYNYVVLTISFLIIIFLYLKQMKEYKNNYTNYIKVDLYIKNKLYKLNGYLDTGNKLYDQYKHRPIILINKRINYKMEDIIYVPYETLNSQNMVKCLKTDKIIINKQIYTNYLVGLSNNKFKIDGINCILHSKMKGYI